MKFKIIYINLLLLITLSTSNAYEYFGIHYVTETVSALYFKVVNKDSVTKTCFLTAPDLEINNLESKDFALTDKDFFYSIYSDENEIDIQTRKKSDFFEGIGKIEGASGRIIIYKFDKETLANLNKYCGIYYSIDKKDSIVINVQDSFSLITSHINKNNNYKEVNILYPTNSDTFISKTGFKYQFKLRNFIPWQIMYISEGQEYFFYKEI